MAKQKMARNQTKSPALARDVLWGVKHGVRFSLLLGGVVALAVGFSPEVEVRGHTLQLWRILGGYLAGGVLGGMALGLLRGHLHRRRTAVPAGAVVGTVVYSALAFALLGNEGFNLVAALIPGVLIGGGAGFILAK